MARRKTASTLMNAESSRSHQIFSVVIESTDLQTQTVTRGKLSFVDLAGSERVKKSGATGEQLKEAMAINMSLSALGNVINALATEQAHVPYRDHRLTMLMSDSLGGSAKTLMFCNVSPSVRAQRPPALQPRRCAHTRLLRRRTTWTRRRTACRTVRAWLCCARGSAWR